ncbi:hypothetical protein GGF32_006936 [Allomyces javanicus]|nr:hypothetical protein GGF32_006936 [Allomyces javanicus]
MRVPAAPRLVHALAALAAVLMVVLAACTASATALPVPVQYVQYADVSGNVVLHFNGIRSSAKLPLLRVNNALAVACRRHAINMAAIKFIGDRGKDGLTAATRATDAGYKWAKIGIAMGMGYPNTNAYLKTVTAASNPWINDRAVLDIGAAWARATPNGQIYYDICWGGPASGAK